jgi:hypothetical protein
MMALHMMLASDAVALVAAKFCLLLTFRRRARLLAARTCKRESSIHLVRRSIKLHTIKQAYLSAKVITGQLGERQLIEA